MHRFFLPLFLIAIVNTAQAFNLADYEWYCHKGFFKGFSALASYDCVENTKKKLYYRDKGSSADIKPLSGGQYRVQNGRIELLIPVDGNKRRLGAYDFAPARQRPQIQTASVATSGGSETTSTRKRSKTSSNDPLYNDYPPRTPAFAVGYSAALKNTSSEWMSLNKIQQAQYLFDKYNALLAAHPFPLQDASLLLCKTQRESNTSVNGHQYFAPQVTTTVPRSDASGISQILSSTAADLFNRYSFFRSRVAGFENIHNGRQFHQAMAGNMIAQMELGMAVMEMKRRDVGCRTQKCLAGHYYGKEGNCQSGVSHNDDYASKVLACKSCIDSQGISYTCLNKATRGACL